MLRVQLDDECLSGPMVELDAVLRLSSIFVRVSAYHANWVSSSGEFQLRYNHTLSHTAFSRFSTNDDYTLFFS